MSQPRRVVGQPGHTQEDGPPLLRVFTWPETLSCIAGPSSCVWPVADCDALHLDCRAIVSSLRNGMAVAAYRNALKDVRASLICNPHPAPSEYSVGHAGSS